MSYNELFGLGSHSEDASLEGWWPLQDNAASTAVDDVSSNGNDGTLVGGDNTSAITTTGPNSYLSAALDLDGTNDYITLPALGVSGSQNRTWLSWCYRDAAGDNAAIFTLGGGGGTAQRYTIRSDTATDYLRVEIQGSSDSSALAFPADEWAFAAIALNGTTLADATFYLDGSTEAGVGATTLATSDTNNFIGASTSGATPWAGHLAGTAFFSRALSTAEMAEAEAGPEPINTVAPALSGTELVGETLTATSGTWALDAPFSGGSNGTVTYSYQWTRSDDDSGTNEADISGATSSTYVLTSSDAGKYIRCRVRATNDGGFDADADTTTAMSGKIATTTLLANLDAHYKLDETSGTVVRNEVRTEVGPNSALTGTGGTAEYGSAPDDWTQSGSGAGEGSATITSVASESTWKTSVLNGGGGNAQSQLRAGGLLTVGVRYTCELRWRLLSEVVGTPNLVSYGGTTVTHANLENFTVADGWQTTVVSLGAASQTNCDAAIVRCLSLNDYAHVEIDSIRVYQENDGTYVNSPTLGVPGKVGTAVTFNGTTQYANCPVAPTSYPFTMAGWVKSDDGANMVAMSLEDASAGTIYWSLGYVNTGNVVQVLRRNTTEVATNTGETFVADTWDHWAIVFEDETTVHVYRNGALVFSDDGLTSVSFSTATDNLVLGRLRTTSPTQYWDGSLDDVRLYDRALDSTDIWELYWLGARTVSIANDPTAVNPFSIFTVPVATGTNIAALTLSSTASDYDWSATSLQHDDEGGGAPYAIIRCVTMISDTFGLCANHQPPDADDVIRFRDVNGDLVTATVLTKTQVGSTDIGVVEFSAAVDANVARLPIVYNPEELIGRWIWASQHNGTVGLYRIGTVTTSGTEGIQVDSNPWGVSINSSGRPLLLPLADGTFGLVSTWYSGTGTGPNIGNYINEINAILAGGNESVTIVDAEAVVFPSAGGTGISQSISTGVARPIAQSISQ